MNTVTLPAPVRKPTRKPRPRPQRFARISRNGPVSVLTIRQVSARGKETIDTYAVEPIPSEMGGRGLALTKPDGVVYNVELNGQLSTCDCPGFESHGWHQDRDTGEMVACKHCMAALALEKAGKL